MFKRWLLSVAAGPWQAGSWAALLSLFAVVGTAAPVMLLSPLLFVASGGVVVLTALRQDINSLGIALLIAAAVLLLAGFLSGLGGALTAVVFAMFWMPLVIASWGVRQGGISRGVQLVVLVSIVLLLGGRFSGFEPGVFLGEYSQLVTQQVTPSPEAEANVARIEGLFAWLERYFWGWVSVSFGVLWMTGLLLGRYWHSMLDNPGAFGREFTALRVGLFPGGIALLLILGALSGAGEIAWELAALMLFGVFWQGLACVHASLVARKVGRIVWIVFYGLLTVFALQVAVVLVLIGLLDNVFNFRARLAVTDEY